MGRDPPLDTRLGEQLGGLGVDGDPAAGAGLGGVLPDDGRARFGVGVLAVDDDLAVEHDLGAGDGGPLQAGELGRFLADRGVTVVSGLARGINQAAHTGALDAGGSTTAVLGTGFGVDYPRRDEALREAVTASGGLYTEYPPGAPPRPAHFLERNRIVAGMTAAVVVVEGQARSGALHTARLAAELGRDVWAVPGSLSAPACRGPLDLIRDGAFCVTSLGDVLASIGLGELPRPADGRPLPPDDVEPTTSALSSPIPAESLGVGDSTTRAVAELLGPQPTSIDALLAATDLGVARLLAVLADLERRGVARTSPRGVTRR